jgi:hypothetical protein
LEQIGITILLDLAYDYFACYRRNLFLDILLFVLSAWGAPSEFMYRLCRPLFGLISGNSIGMMIGFLIRIAEVVWIGIVIGKLIN